MIQPTRDTVLVRPEEAEDVTSGGIIYTDTKSKTLFYIVEAIGSDVTDVKVGDSVLLPRIQPTFTYENTEYYVVNPIHIMAVKV